MIGTVFQNGAQMANACQYRAVDPHSFYADPDPDSAVFLNADPDPDPSPGPGPA